MRSFLLGILLFLFTLFQPAYAEQGWWVDRFHSDISIESTGEVHVKENIDVDFDILSKHGIFRVIPVIYHDNGSETYTKVNVVQVRQNGTRAKYQILREGDYLQLKIGDPNRTISGKNSYEIAYVAKGILRS